MERIFTLKKVPKKLVHVFIKLGLICLWLISFSQPVFAQPSNTEIRKADTFLDLNNQEVISTEQFQFRVKSDKTSLIFDFPVSSNQSSDILSEVSLSEQGSELDIFIVAEKVIDGAQNTSSFTYKTTYSEIDELMRVEVFYYFEANLEYTLRFKFDHTALLDLSKDYAFLVYPIANPQFANAAERYTFHCELPYEILPEEYRIQSVAETWFQDQTSNFSNINYSSSNFRYRNEQFIYLSLPASLFPSLQTNEPDMQVDNFFPNPESIQVIDNSLQRLLSQPFLIFVIFIASVILLAFIYFIYEYERIINVDKIKLDSSIFELDAAHSGYLLKPEENTNYLLAGLIQLVQKNEVELTKTTFHWLYPNRDDFSKFSSSEVFLLQWLFQDKNQIAKVKHSVISAEKINLYVDNDEWAEDFLLNFKKYISLLQADLVKADYISAKNKRRGRRLYLGLAILIFSLLTLLILIGKSLFSLVLLLPLLFALHRYYRARFLTIKGRIKLKQMASFKLAFRSVDRYFESQKKWIKTRDLAPLILSYAMSFHLLEAYLDQLNENYQATLGILDLMDEEHDYSNLALEMITEKWLAARTDILRMYYLFSASLVSSKIKAQKKLIDEKRI